MRVIGKYAFDGQPKDVTGITEFRLDAEINRANAIHQYPLVGALRVTGARRFGGRATHEQCLTMNQQRFETKRFAQQSREQRVIAAVPSGIDGVTDDPRIGPQKMMDFA